MSLETGDYVQDLTSTNPVGGTDSVREGDDHIRLIKKVLLATFPDASKAYPDLTTTQIDVGTSQIFGFISPELVVRAIDAHPHNRVAVVGVFAPTETLATGDGRAYFPIPPELNNYNLIVPHAQVATAPTSSNISIQIHNVTDGVDMLSTPLTIDDGEKSSHTAATPPVVNGAADDVVTGDLLRVDVDAVGSGVAGVGLWVALRFEKQT